MLQKGFVSPILIIVLVILFAVIVSGFYLGLNYFFPRSTISNLENNTGKVQEASNEANFNPINSTEGDIPMERSIFIDDPKPTITPTITSVLKSSVKAQELANGKRSVSFKKVEWSEHWRDFTVSFDSSWIVERAEQTKDSLSLELKRGDTAVAIYQGISSGGQCFYSEESVDGRGMVYTNKSEITKGSTIWRLSELSTKYESPNSFEVCEAENGSSVFTNNTLIGLIDATIDSTKQKDLTDLIEILKNIEIK